MQTHHTPAPWVFEESTKTIRSKPENYWIASMNSWDGAINHEVNARLIAAAPELLEALDDCAGVLQSIENQLSGKSVAVTAVLEKARAAIKKTEGVQS